MNNRGFTLIELLVVISIISIISTVVLQQLNSARQKAKDTKIYTEMDQLKKAFELYRNDNGAYLGLGEQNDIFWCTTLIDCGGQDLKVYFKSYLVDKKYISSIPEFGGSSMYYFAGSNIADNYLIPLLETDVCGNTKITKYLFMFTTFDGRPLNLPTIQGTTNMYCIGV